MAIWEVSEPLINVFLYDEPLSYQPGLGSKISFKLTYKQRETRTFYTGVSGNYTGFGPNWHCSWAGYLYRNYTISGGTTNYDGTGTVVLPDGGQRTFMGDSATPEFYSQGILTPTANPDGSWKSATIVYPDASMEVYSNVVRLLPGLPSYPILYLVARYDRFGNAVRFNWIQPLYPSGNAYLQYVVDADGRTNTLSYTGTRVTSVQDPFGRTASLQYDSNGLLTNITDPESLSSSFIYNANTWVTNLHTPYGNTGFEYVGSGFGINDGVIRAVRVSDAAGGTNVYMLTQCDGPDSFSIPYMPDVPNNFDGCLGYFLCRDSYHWGPRQSVGLPQDLTTVGFTDFIRARMRHWAHSTNSYSSGTFDYGNGIGVSLSLDMEVEPSPDGVNSGQVTFYDYPDRAYGSCFYAGSSSLPSLVARTLPDTTIWFTWYQRDEMGRPTNVVDSYSTGYGVTPLYRTNIYVYNGADLIAHYGPNGNLEDGYGYNGQHQVTSYTNAVGDVASYTYDSFGRLTGSHTPAGLTTTNLYFTSGDYTNFLQTTIDLEIARTNSYTWANDLVSIYTDERGMATTNIYDNLQRATNILDARGKIVSTYNKLDLVQVVDRMGFTNSFGYDAVRRKVAETNALGFFTLYNYCTCGALDSIQDAAGNVTSFYYDNAGRMTNAVYPDGYSITNIYDSLGELIIETDSASISVTNWFNNQGLRYTAWNVAGQISLLQFDIKDQPVYVTDANGVTITNTYDPLGRLFTRGYPDGGVERFGYSPRGMVAYTNQLNFTNFYVYDAAMRKTFETNANGEVIRYTNGAAGDLLSLTDGKNQTTRWKYDLFGRVTNKIDQAGTTVLKCIYDSDNRLTNRSTAAFGAITYKYDRVGNLTNVVYPVTSPVTPNVTFKYDALNRLTNMVDGIGTNTYAYTAAGQLLIDNGPFANDTITNVYWNRLRTEMDLQQPVGLWTNAFAYDVARRLVEVTSRAGEFDYQYRDSLPSTLVVKLLLPNTAYITNTYDSNARLLTTWLKTSGGVVRDSATYAYNVGNQRTAAAFTNASASLFNYSYDRISQVKVADSSVNSEDRGYKYDAAWNLNNRTNNGVMSSFTVDVKNQLTLDGDGNSDTYDSEGDLTSGQSAYFYNAEHRLVGFVNGGGDLSLPGSLDSFRTDFFYDGLGRLRKKVNYTAAIVPEIDEEIPVWVSQNETHYLYDGWRVVQERDTNNVPTVSYTRGNDLSGTLVDAGGIGGLLARSHAYQSGSGNWTNHNYYHADAAGNITAMVNSSQTLVASYRYDAFGNTLNKSGTLVDANVYRFSSKEIVRNDFWDSELYYYGYRFYSPRLQRWLNRDPIEEKGGVNLFGYDGNNPVNKTDPLGLCDVKARCHRVIELGFLPVGWHCGIVAPNGVEFGLTGVGIGGSVGSGDQPVLYPTEPNPQPQDPPAGSKDYPASCGKCKSCDDVQKCIQNYHDTVTPPHYYATGPNSNTYAHDMLDKCGCSVDPIPRPPYTILRSPKDGGPITVHPGPTTTPPGAVAWNHGF